MKFGRVTLAWAQVETEYNQHATGHVFSQKVLYRAADDDDRAFVLLLFHVDGHAVASVINAPPDRCPVAMKPEITYNKPIRHAG